MTELQTLTSRLDDLERRLQAPLFNNVVAAGAGIMPSKLAAALNAGQTAALISGNTNLEQDIQDILSGAVTFTSLTISAQNAITFTHATAELIPGATSITFRNNADNASNMVIADAGGVTFRAGLSGITTLNMSGLYRSTDTTNATDATGTGAGGGALGTLGGLSVVKAAWIGGLMNVAGAVTLQSTLGVTGTITGAAINISGVLTSTNATDATSINTGSIITDGGVGIEKALWVGGLANIAGAVTAQNILTVSGASGGYALILSTGNIDLSGVSASGIKPGATSFAIRNNADNANNLLVSDAGALTVRTSLTIAGAIAGATTIGASGVVTLSATAAGTLLVGNQSGATTLGLITVGGGVTLLGTGVANGLRIYPSSGTHQFDVYLNSTNLRIDDNTGGGAVNITCSLIVGTMAATGVTDKYVTVDASGNITKSTLGPGA